MSPLPNPLPAGAAATLACLYEATAPKPGNVHPRASFCDATTYAHFVASAVVIGPIIERMRNVGIGQTVLEAVQVTRNTVGTNTNLGTLLLLAPLAAASAETTIERGIGCVLDDLTADDTRHVYEAIRLAAAGGLGRADEADVHAEPPNRRLFEVMQMAAERDLVARQYTNAFADVFSGPVSWITDGRSRGWPLSAAIVRAYLQQMAKHPDSLIARKCGLPVAVESSRRAGEALATGSPGEAHYDTALADLDHWLRGDGNRRNPGTSADFIAAGLFVLLREGRLHWSEW